jgi:glycosyltransferase involved in cell wall biosynthesis
LSIKVCFLGGARYRWPLDETSRKKFKAMSLVGEIFVIGFSSDVQPRIFTEHAHFYLLPQLWLPVLRYIELFIIGQILTFWLIVRHGIQVVVAQSPYEGFIAALPIKLAKWCGHKAALVVEVHGDFAASVFMYRRIRFSSLYGFVMKHVAAYSIKQADLLRAISQSTSEQLRRWAPTKAIVQFPAWTDFETFLRSGANRGNEFSNAILFVGVLVPLKGIHHLINAFSLIAGQFPTVHLSIVGKDENKAYAEGLKTQVANLALNGRVHFIGPLAQSELAERMSKAAALVLPSLSEGLGRVIIEAMATGTPAIGSRVGGIPELIENEFNGFLIPPGDERALADKLRWVLENRDEARAMGERARAFAAQRFSTAQYLHGYRQIFEMTTRTSEQRNHAASSLQPSN